MGDLHWRDSISAINTISSAPLFFLSVPAEKHWKHFERLRSSLETLSRYKQEKKVSIYNAPPLPCKYACQAGNVLSGNTPYRFCFSFGTGKECRGSYGRATGPGKRSTLHRKAMSANIVEQVTHRLQSARASSPPPAWAAGWAAVGSRLTILAQAKFSFCQARIIKHEYECINNRKSWVLCLGCGVRRAHVTSHMSRTYAYRHSHFFWRQKGRCSLLILSTPIFPGEGTLAPSQVNGPLTQCPQEK